MGADPRPSHKAPPADRQPSPAAVRARSSPISRGPVGRQRRLSQVQRRSPGGFSYRSSLVNFGFGREHLHRQDRSGDENNLGFLFWWPVIGPWPSVCTMAAVVDAVVLVPCDAAVRRSLWATRFLRPCCIPDVLFVAGNGVANSKSFSSGRPAVHSGVDWTCVTIVLRRTCLR